MPRVSPPDIPRISPPELCILVVSSGLAGAEKRFLRIMALLSSTAYCPWLITNPALVNAASGSPEFAPIIARLRAIKRIHIIPSDGELSLRGLYRSYLDLRKVIAIQNLKSMHAVLSFNTPVLLSLTGSIRVAYEVTSPDVARGLLNRRKRAFLRYISTFNAVSPSVCRKLLSEFEGAGMSYLSQRVITSPIPFFDGARYSEYPIPEKENLVVYAARLVPRKNPILFARVAKRFLAQKPDWKVAILGSGPCEGEIRDILREETQSGAVTIGYVNDIFAYLARSKIFTSLIQEDNYPSQSIMEAMYMRNAILASDVGETGRFVSPSNGALVRLDEEEVLRTLMNLASGSTPLNALGEESHRLVCSRFSPDLYLKHLYQIHNVTDQPQ